MSSISSGTFGRLFAICVAVQVCLAGHASAQHAGQPAQIPSSQTLTGKERLGRKWMDEQRIDNCNVPVDKRGTKPRPSACPHVPMG